MSSTPGPSAPSTPSMEPDPPVLDSREYTKPVYHVQTAPLQLAPLPYVGMYPVNSLEFSENLLKLMGFCLNHVNFRNSCPIQGKGANSRGIESVTPVIILWLEVIRNVTDDWRCVQSLIYKSFSS